MWLLTFIPDSILLAFVNIILYSGIILSVLGFVFNFRFLAQYRLIVQVVGILLLASGLYFKGGYQVEITWRARAAELEAKVKDAELKAQKTNVVIQEKVVTKIQKVKDTQVKIKEVIKEKEKIINAECVVPKEAVEILNEAARGPQVEEKR